MFFQLMESNKKRDGIMAFGTGKAEQCPISFYVVLIQYCSV